MRKILLILIVIANCFQVKSQVTFEKIYPFTSAFAIIEMANQSFIGCGDSSQLGLIYSMDHYGNLNGTFFPKLRGNNVIINDISLDPNTNGFAICGTSADTTGNNYTGYYLLMNGGVQNTDSIFYNGGLDGPSCDNILRTSNNDFIVTTDAWNGGGSNTSAAHKVNYPGWDGWSTIVGTDQTLNSFALDASDNLVSATFGYTAAAGASLNVFDTAGNNLHSYSITDTAYGGSLIFEAVTSISPEGGYMFGVNVSPNGSPNGVVYLAKLDTATNVIWDKYLDWNINANITAITKTADSCIVLLLSTSNGMALYKMNSAGDSLWTQFHNRSTTGYGYRFRQCSDGGFVIVGQFNDTISHAYVLKTDSLGRLVPDATLSVSGALEFCLGDSTMISAQPGYNYLWSTGDTTQSITVFGPGDYFVTVSDNFGGQVNSDTLNIVVHTPVQPTIAISGDTLFASTADLYQWYLNGTLIVGETTPIYVAVANGIYQVETWDIFGCSALSEPDTLTTVSVSEISNLLGRAILFPNPTSNESMLTIQFIQDGKVQVELINALGKVANLISSKQVKANEVLQVPVSTEKLEQGIYIVRIINEENSGYLRLLVLH